MLEPCNGKPPLSTLKLENLKKHHHESELTRQYLIIINETREYGGSWAQTAKNIFMKK